MGNFYYRPFDGTYKYYVKYLAGDFQKVIDLIIITDYFNLKSADGVLNVGCGTEQVDRALEGRRKEMVNVDADSEMFR